MVTCWAGYQSILYLARITVGSSFSRASLNHAQLTFTKPTGSAECKIAMLSFVHNFVWYNMIPDLGFCFGLTLHATCLVRLGLMMHSAGPILVQGREQAGMTREIPKACARATGTVHTIVFTAPDALFFFFPILPCFVFYANVCIFGVLNFYMVFNFLPCLNLHHSATESSDYSLKVPSSTPLETVGQARNRSLTLGRRRWASSTCELVPYLFKPATHFFVFVSLFVYSFSSHSVFANTG